MRTKGNILLDIFVPLTEHSLHLLWCLFLCFKSNIQNYILSASFSYLAFIIMVMIKPSRIRQNDFPAYT
jgi:hypothetical protein